MKLAGVVGIKMMQYTKIGDGKPEDYHEIRQQRVLPLL